MYYIILNYQACRLEMVEHTPINYSNLHGYIFTGDGGGGGGNGRQNKLNITSNKPSVRKLFTMLVNSAQFTRPILNI